MGDFPWDDYKGGGDFVTFQNIGDSVSGEILSIRVGKDFNGNPCPELLLKTDDGAEKTLTAGQKVLQSALAEERPEVGDRIGIIYSGVGDAKPGKAPAKLFDVAVKRQGSSPAASASGVSAESLV